MTIIVASIGIFPCAHAAEFLVVRSNDAGPYRKAEQALQQQLTQLGHGVKSKPLADFRADYPLQPDVTVIAIGTQAAHSLDETLPVTVAMVYCMVTNTASLELAPDRRAWGVVTDIDYRAQCDLITEALPSARAIGLLYNGRTKRGTLLLRQFREAAPDHWRLEPVDVSKFDATPKAITELFDRHVDLVWTAPDSSIFNAATIRQLLLTGLRRDTPIFGFSPSFVRAGALIGTGIDPQMQGRQAANLCHRMVSEPQSANELRQVERPSFELAVNQVVADKLSIDLPKALVARAKYVFDPARNRKK